MKLFSELRKRNFCKIGVVYVATAWLVWQMVALAVENIALPGWTMQAFRWSVIVAFPVVMVAAWLLELTPDGLRLQKNVDPARSIARKTGRQLTRGIVVILAMALVLYLTGRFRDQLRPEPNDTVPDTDATGQVEHVEAGNWFVALNCGEMLADKRQGPA
jgi:hypothetical protein